MSCGWRGDSWGVVGHHNNDYESIHDLYPNLWETGIVAMEVSGVMDDWADRINDPNDYERTLPIEQSVTDALQWHSTLAHNKAADIPTEYINHPDPSKADLNSMARKMGHRLVLSQLSYANQVNAGGDLHIDSLWHNRGIAPLYRDFRIAIRFRNTQGNVVGEPIVSNTSVKGLLPTNSGNPISKNPTITIPQTLSSGLYKLDVGIVYHSDSSLRMPIAINNPNINDWYEMGQIQVNAGTPVDPEIPVTSVSVPVNQSDKLKIIDNNTSSTWSNNGVFSDGYFELGLDGIYEISKIRYNDGYNRDLKISLNDQVIFDGSTSGLGNGVSNYAEIIPSTVATGILLGSNLTAGTG